MVVRLGGAGRSNRRQDAGDVERLGINITSSHFVLPCSKHLHLPSYATVLLLLEKVVESEIEQAPRTRSRCNALTIHSG